MSDLHDRLRALADDLTGNYVDAGDDFYGPDTDWGWLHEAADRIAELEAEVRAAEARCHCEACEWERSQR